MTLKIQSTLMIVSLTFCLMANKKPNHHKTIVDSEPLISNSDTLIDPFLKLDYDEVFIYNFNYDSAKKQRLNLEFSVKSFNFNKVNKTSLKKLDSSTVNGIIKTLSDTATYGGQTYACFLPRMGLTFLKDKKTVFNVLICLECNYLESTARIPAMFHYDYKIFPDDATPITLYNMGFSDKGKQALLEICSSSGLAFCKNE